MSTIDENNSEIESLKIKLQNVDTETFSNKMRKIQEEVDALEKSMRELKLRKFRRDKRDYNQDRVYTFSLRPQTKRVT